MSMGDFQNLLSQAHTYSFKGPGYLITKPEYNSYCLLSWWHFLIALELWLLFFLWVRSHFPVPTIEDSLSHPTDHRHGNRNPTNDISPLFTPHTYTQLSWHRQPVLHVSDQLARRNCANGNVWDVVGVTIVSVWSLSLWENQKGGERFEQKGERFRGLLCKFNPIRNVSVEVECRLSF